MGGPPRSRSGPVRARALIPPPGPPAPLLMRTPVVLVRAHPGGLAFSLEPLCEGPFPNAVRQRGAGGQGRQAEARASCRVVTRQWWARPPLGVREFCPCPWPSHASGRSPAWAHSVAAVEHPAGRPTAQGVEQTPMASASPGWPAAACHAFPAGFVFQLRSNGSVYFDTVKFANSEGTAMESWCPRPLGIRKPHRGGR